MGRRVHSRQAGALSGYDTPRSLSFSLRIVVTVKISFGDDKDMRALIIAAGRGERLKPFTDMEPKPLIPLLGLRLVERVIISVREAEIREVVIVIGHLGEKLKRFLGNGSKYGVKIKYVKNNRWEMGNGVSVYEARNLLKENFILLMSDHLFNPRILSALRRFKIGIDECVLCVDMGMRYVFDIDDATKVKVVHDKIVEIGKGLEEFNGVDMGIFLCSPHIFKILERNIEKGFYSLTEGIRELAKQGKMKAYCIENDEDYWIDIDTFEILKIAENMLLMYDQVYGAIPGKVEIERSFTNPLSNIKFLDLQPANEKSLRGSILEEPSKDEES
ncbi:MAG: phosphocholine cytidylyltransferase family protein [Nitrososphaerales archaeon]